MAVGCGISGKEIIDLRGKNFAFVFVIRFRKMF